MTSVARLWTPRSLRCNREFHGGGVFYGGRNIWNQTVLKQLVTSFVLSRIDYCNSLLINLPTSTIAPLQRVQNAARLVLGLDRRAYTGAKTTTLVASSIQFKIATPMHQIYHRHCPQYLVNLVSFTSDAAGQRLRSNSDKGGSFSSYSHEPWKTSLSVAGPSVWNSLPSSLRLTDSHKQFLRLQLKTYCFNVAFSLL